MMPVSGVTIEGAVLESDAGNMTQGIPGIAINLMCGGGSILKTRMTNKMGQFFFSHEEPCDSYRLTLALNEGFHPFKASSQQGVVISSDTIEIPGRLSEDMVSDNYFYVQKTGIPQSEGNECPPECSCLPEEAFTHDGITRCTELPCGQDPEGRPQYCGTEREITPETLEHECPEGCSCLPEEAFTWDEITRCTELPSGKDPEGRPQYCGTEGEITPETLEHRCPEGCSCLPEEAFTWDEITRCTELPSGKDPEGRPQYCGTEGEITPETLEHECPEGCSCLPEETFIRDEITRCSDLPCGQDPEGRLQYCGTEREISPETLEHECPEGCSCLLETDAIRQYGEPVQCSDIHCGIDRATEKPLYCYQNLIQREPELGENESPEPEPEDYEMKCPEDCNCVTAEEAKSTWGEYSLCSRGPCGISENNRGEKVKKYCSRPACSCLTEGEAKQQFSTYAKCSEEICGYKKDEYCWWCTGTPQYWFRSVPSVQAVIPKTYVIPTVNLSQYIDTDNDGIPDGSDNCPKVKNPDQKDSEQKCWWVELEKPYQMCSDIPDGIGDDCDNCQSVSNPDQKDADSDGFGDACDRCPNDNDSIDQDLDSVPDCADNCLNISNMGQKDWNGDGVGDECDCFDKYQGPLETGPDYGGPCNLSYLCSLSPLPAQFDWRSVKGKNWLTPVKNQGGCGSCWAFGALAVVESTYKIDNPAKADLDLSEQYLVSPHNPTKKPGSCLGGQPSLALSEIKEYGVPEESMVPYNSSICIITGPSGKKTCPALCSPTGSNCQGCHCSNPITSVQVPIGTKMATITGYTSPITTKGNYVTHGTILKKALLCYGPLVVVSKNWWHVVTLIGWDDTWWNNQGGWLIKNSWGANWNSFGTAGGYGLIPYNYIYGDLVNETYYVQGAWYS